MQPELEQLAREAGLDLDDGVWLAMPDELERFALLVEQRAMERAAVICEGLKVGMPSYFEIDERIQECAAAIRSSAPRANGGEG